MNTTLEVALQSFGLRKVQPTSLDLKLLTDSIGRTLPMSGYQLVGDSPAKWLGAKGQDLVKNGYTNHHVAYSVINYILSVAQAIPWGVYKVTEEDAAAELLPKHPLAETLYRPNPRQSWADLKTELEGYLLTTGNAYVYGIRLESGPNRGKMREWWALEAPIVEVMGGGRMQEVTGYRIPDGRGGYINYEVEDVLHLKYWNPGDYRYGLSPITAGIDPVTAAKSGIESRVRQYQNAGPPGLITDASPDNADWTDAQQNRLQGWFRSFFSGGRRSGDIPLVTGDIRYVSTGLGPVDLAVLEAIPHDKDSVADLFRFPGQLLNGSKGTTFSNMGEAGKALYNRCVIPLETIIRDGFNRWLGEEYNDEAYFNFSTSDIAELQEDKAQRAIYLDKAWWIPVVEKQRLDGVKPDWDGPKYMVPAQYVGLNEAVDTDSAEAAEKLLNRLGVDDYKDRP
ncbi:phage portal protein [Hymenobacter aerilatus]|uniref:Phage portal protein n=1 Tax=Hymenobacter aerilatus TaxID=2932251 RepID=A0A8T9T2K0_9BACT|nr:phage portal protein [Hymenobacter aerilatus]UOR07183.1 phage portal protein [Hymenobacter aerilatus]